MSNSYQECHPAKYKYQEVKYFPFDVEPGASYVLTSNPWAFLRAWLAQEMEEHNEPKKSRFRNGKYYLDVAEDFHIAANNTHLPTKGTLTYYSLLNLVKVYLAVNGVDLERGYQDHGLSLKPTQTDEINVKGDLATGGKGDISIFHEFCKLLGTPVAGKHDVKIQEIIGDIPEIHELAYTLGHLPNNRRSFLPVSIEFLVNEDKTKLFTELSFEKKNEERVSIEKFFKGKRKGYFYKKDEVDGWLIYRCIAGKRKIIKNTDSNWMRIYRNICKEYRDFNISSIITRYGYKFYINLEPGRYHQLANSLALIFFIGSAARYRPTLMKGLMGGKLYPILTEAVETCPNQFLYHISSMVTNRVCAVPQAKL